MWSMFSRKSVLVGAALLCSLSVSGLGAVLADELRAEDVQLTTPVYEANTEDFNPALGTYVYTTSWQGIPAADLTVSIEREGPTYRIIAAASTYSGIDVFYKLRYRADAQISSSDFTPIRSEYRHRENSKLKYTEIRFMPSGEIQTVYNRKGKGSTGMNFNPNNFTLDPFSAAFIARSLHWDVGDTRSFDAFVGKSRYLIKLSCVDKVKVRVNGSEREVWVIEPSAQNVTKPGIKSKLRKAQIYVTADKAREILQIKSEVFIGTVKTKLKSFTPSTRPQPATQVARASAKRSFIK